MFLHKTPGMLRWLYPQLTWKCRTDTKNIFLTFDDGPIPELTDYILEELAKYHAKATFFCVGENLKKYPEIAKRVMEAGHTLGNHTHNHLNGWKTSTSAYIQNVKECEQILRKLGQSSGLFRPPYGRISRKQISKLKKDYKIIMWDVLSGDFSASVTPENCLQKSIKATSGGSIVVFHDNIKATSNIKYTLPRYLKYFHEGGYQFKSFSPVDKNK